MPQVLPMIEIKKEAQDYEPGLNTLKTIIEKRLLPYVKELSSFHLQRSGDPYELGIFDSQETRLKLCRMTGGHVRELMLFIQSAMDWIDDLPITETAINEARDSTYRVAVDEHEWEKLAIVYRDKNCLNDEEYHSLLFRRCVLEYRPSDSQGNTQRWYDIHPLIEEIDEFKAAMQRLNRSKSD